LLGIGQFDDAVPAVAVGQCLDQRDQLGEHPVDLIAVEQLFHQ
jgi:hypothetical protein